MIVHLRDLSIFNNTGLSLPTCRRDNPLEWLLVVNDNRGEEKTSGCWQDVTCSQCRKVGAKLYQAAYGLPRMEVHPGGKS